jgi:hypothetical protein
MIYTLPDSDGTFKALSDNIETKCSNSH